VTTGVLTASAYQRLTQHFGTHSLKGLVRGSDLSGTAAGVVLEYLQETQRVA
jgi:DNA mismatch repair ATPase MutS